MTQDIAIVGAGCRFPDAWNPQEFWSNIDSGVVSARELSDDQLRACGISEELLRSPEYIRIATALPGVEDFAADFFNYPPREARQMDPQQRIFMEVCWEALESAGHPPSHDGPRIGVFAASAAGHYAAAMFALHVHRSGLADAVMSLDLAMGGEPDFLTARVAYKLGLRGPSMGVQTACSSSLYAIHYASRSLRSGDCDIALAGGATVLEPVRGYRYQPGGGLSEDGYCRSFDYRSTGTSHSSGVGVVVLRRLADALADGDPILAVVKGTSVGNDGDQKAGFSAPSPTAIADTVGTVLRIADVPAEQIRYVEANGTAMPLGDHVELTALTTAFRSSTNEIGFCGLGSVKANIGNTGQAASIAGMLKAINIVRTGSVPPHPMFERARDPGILAESPFYITTTPRTITDPDRHVLLNCTGLGGANGAAVIAPPPAPTRPAATATDRVRLVVSARNRVELDRMSKNLADAIDKGDTPVPDLAHTLRVGRRGFDERRVVTAAPHELAAALRFPRPPLVRSVRSTPRRAVIVVPKGTEAPDALLDGLRAALPERTEVVADATRHAPPEWFRILLGDGESSIDQHVVPLDGDQDRLDEAVTAAWLHGVPVRWTTLSNGDGRRVSLPTYPFDRQRYWPFDREPLSDLSTPKPANGSAPVVADEALDAVEKGVLSAWRDLFGTDTIGRDDEFGALGGTSLLSVQLVLGLRERFGVLVNVHRAGGNRSTVRRMADLVRGLLGDPGQEQPGLGKDADDERLVDQDLQLPIGTLVATPARGRDMLLTGATGFVGAFLLHELLLATTGRVYCLVRAADEAEGLARIQKAAADFLLPEPDPERVRAVPGDLRDITKVGASYRDGELEARVGHVLHCAAKVVFTEPYGTLREDNVLPLAGLLTWMRGNGIRDLSFVSSSSATAPALGTNGRALETRDQPLDPRVGGYGVTKWVGERLLDRADADGMRIRVFRPGLIMSASDTGAGNDKDLIYFALASGLAVGAHPIDDRIHSIAPVDIVAKGIVELAISPGSVGRAYHVVAEKPVRLRHLFALLGEAGLPTRPVEPAEWRDLVRELALSTGNPVLSSAALLELGGEEPDADGMQAAGWLPWLRRNGINPTVTGDMLRDGLAYLAQHNELFGALLPDLANGKAATEEP